jgi:aspartyl-tRNA(Asn)/glutamyl-tRNA(Gln) amidotransferase subunit A
MNLTELTLHQALSGLRKKQFSSHDLVAASLNRIRKIDGQIRAFLTTNPKAEDESQKIDKLKNYQGLVAGIPTCIKDVLTTKDLVTTAGSRTLKGYEPPYNATVVDRLLDQQAVIVGKGNCDAFAFGASGENSGYYPTHNPWDLSRVPGGSSSGPAAAVASQEVSYAIGTDTGGSIRQPASLCGIVGLKISYGRSSRYGLIAMASSFDTPGPLTRTVEDAALVLQAIAGQDQKDATSSAYPVDNYLTNLKKGVKGLKIGLPKEYFIKGSQPEVNEAVQKAAKKLEKLGAKIVNISLPHTEYSLAVYYTLVPCEISSNMARYDGIRYGYQSKKGDKALDNIAFNREESFEDELKRRIMIGTFALSSGYYEAYYKKGVQVRELIKRDFIKAFTKVDAILSPTSPTTAFKLGEKSNDPLSMYLSDIFTVSANVAGIPGISVPCGFDNQGLPIGLQIMGPAFQEAKILQIAYAYEQSTDWHKKYPVL